MLSRHGEINTTYDASLVFCDPYILAMSGSHVEVLHMSTGAVLQIIWGQYKLLSASPELLMVQSSDGRVLGLQFPD